MTNFLSLFAGVALAAASIGQPGNQSAADPCAQRPSQSVDPIDLDVGVGKVHGCGDQNRVCHLAAVLGCDGVYVKYTATATMEYWATFAVEPSAANGFSVETVAWDSYGMFPGTESIAILKWGNENSFEERAAEIRFTYVDGGRYVEATANVDSTEAASYISGDGEIVVRVRVSGTPDLGASDRWVDEVEIVIPP